MFVNNINILDIKKSDVIARVKVELIARFSIVDMGPVSF